MSLSYKEKINCNKCSIEFEAPLYSSVNATENPELREQILSNTFFIKKCPKCGHTIQILHDLLYHDMDRKFMVWMKIPEGNSIAFEMFALEGLTKMLQNYRLRVVTYPYFLVEKIHVFENDLDDRIVELYKFMLKVRLGYPLETPNDFMHFNSFTKSVWGFKKIQINYIDNDGNITKEAYTFNKKIFLNATKLVCSIEQSLVLNKWYLVDWKYPYGIEIIDGVANPIIDNSEIIEMEIGGRRKPYPKQLLDKASSLKKAQRIY